MTRVGVLGATGKVGQLLLKAILAADDLVLAAAVTHAGSARIGLDASALVGHSGPSVPIVAISADAFSDCDVVIDFSLPQALDAALAGLTGRPLVTGTTGLSDEQHARLAAHATTAPQLAAANFSVGVTVLGDLVARAAAALPDYDIDVVEAHHRRKIDAPSGTALYLAQRAAEARAQALPDVMVTGRAGAIGPRPPQEIGVLAVRGGDIVGEHTVWLAGEGDRLLLGHVATSRETFAMGALRAARWLVGRPAGAHQLRDVLGLR